MLAGLSFESASFSKITVPLEASIRIALGDEMVGAWAAFMLQVKIKYVNIFNNVVNNRINETILLVEFIYFLNSLFYILSRNKEV